MTNSCFMAKIVSDHFERDQVPGHHQMNNQVGGVFQDVIGEQPLEYLMFNVNDLVKEGFTIEYA